MGISMFFSCTSILHKNPHDRGVVRPYLTFHCKICLQRRHVLQIVKNNVYCPSKYLHLVIGLLMIKTRNIHHAIVCKGVARGGGAFWGARDPPPPL